MNVPTASALGPSRGKSWGWGSDAPGVGCWGRRGTEGGWGRTETREERGVWLGKKLGSKSRASSWVWRYIKPAREVTMNRAGQLEMEQVLPLLVFLRDATVLPLATWEYGL